MQFQPKRPNNFKDSIESWSMFTGKRFVETFTGQPGISRNLCHAFSASNIAKCLGNEGGVSVSFFETGIKISAHFLRSSEVFGTS